MFTLVHIGLRIELRCNKPEASSDPLGDEPVSSCSSRSSRFPVRSLGSHSGSPEPPFPTRSRPAFSLGSVLNCGTCLSTSWLFLASSLLDSSSRESVRAVPPSSLLESSPHILVSVESSLLFLGSSCSSRGSPLPDQLLPGSVTCSSAKYPPWALRPLCELSPETASNHGHSVASAGFATRCLRGLCALVPTKRAEWVPPSSCPEVELLGDKAVSADGVRLLPPGPRA